MPHLTKHRAAVIAAVIAIVVYLLALRNGWAGDDMILVRDNPASHSIGAALRAWFEPYWPEEFRWAGLYRPFTILSYAVDWQILGGATSWFHLTNVLLHGLATALVVWVVAQWLAPVGALAAGVLFAVHAVHVEAVANVVGRAEILVAVGLLAAVLFARLYRRATTSMWRTVWLAAVLIAALLAMASKEHGVLALVLIALDHYLDPEAGGTHSVPVYAAVTALTLAWLFVWRGIAGGYVSVSGHAALAYLTTGERWATMFPTYLEVLRLLAWPVHLASDYSPQVIPIRHGFGWLAALGLLSSSALLLLGLATVKRAPPVAFGILAAAASYLPTSNLFFASGVVLGERNLYLAVLAPAAGFGWLVVTTWGGQYRRTVSIAASTAVLLLCVRTVDRIPFWYDARDTIAEEQTAHPENYQTRIVLARYLAALRDSSWALAEILVAGELFPSDPGAADMAARHATAQGRLRLARREAERAYTLMPTDPGIIEQLARVFYQLGQTDSAIAVAATGIDSAPRAHNVADVYAFLLGATDAPRWRRMLIVAKGDWLRGELAAATARLDSALVELPEEPASDVACADVRRSLAVVAALNQVLADRLAAPVAEGGAGCSPDNSP